MKSFKIILLVTVLALVSCNQVEFETIDPATYMGEKVPSTISIADLKSQYVTSSGMFTADQVGDRDVVVNGIVTSTDVEGNVYKYITIQEEIPGGEALKISVDVSGLSGIYPLGQRVSVRASDLYIGKYAESVQLGVYYYNAERSRVEPGRMPKLISDKAIIAYDMPDPAAIVADTMTIAQIRASGPELVNKLVCIKDAYFTGKGANFGVLATIPAAERIFAPSTNGVGYPQSREIKDPSGASIFVSTSEYAKFATKPLPASSVKGNITAIIGWYNDRDTQLSSTKIYHQLTIRRMSDLGKGFEAYHAAN